MTYIFVVTFFVAIFALDERRIEQRRNAFVPCVIHTEEQSKIWYQKNLMHTCLEYIYSNFILTKAGKVNTIENNYMKSSFAESPIFLLLDFNYNVCYMHDWTQH